MPRDYAKQRVLQPSAKKKRANRPMVLFFVFALILSGAGLFWFIQHNLSQKNVENGAVSRLKAFFTHKKTVVTRVSKPKLPPQDDVRFDFYTELPNVQVSPVAIASMQESPLKKLQTAPASQSGTFIIQLGVFENENKASEARLSLLLNQLETEVVEFDDQGRKRYRLQHSGFVDIAQAKTMQKKFQAKGFESVIKKL